MRRSDDGFTVIEMAVAGLVGALVLGLAGSLLFAVQRTGLFAQGQSATLNDARNAMQAIAKETRGADFMEWCATDGSCLKVGAQTPTASFETLRYTYADSALHREIYDPEADSWSDPQVIIDRVTNPSSQPVFACDTQSTLLRVKIDLYIEPTPRSDPNFNLSTTVRPRNFPSKAACP